MEDWSACVWMRQNMWTWRSSPKKEQQRIAEERRRLPEAIAGMQREWDMRRLG